MNVFTTVSDEDLALARRDPLFRQKLLTQNLDQLLSVLNALQRSNRAAAPAFAKQVREGAQLAVQLADIIRRLDGENAGKDRSADSDAA